MTVDAAPAKAVPVRRGLGTFGGVFTPSILTMLGVIMYLRFGWVVGILQALARDDILPKPMRIVGRGVGPNDEPRIERRVQTWRRQPPSSSLRTTSI